MQEPKAFSSFLGIAAVEESVYLCTRKKLKRQKSKRANHKKDEKIVIHTDDDCRLSVYALSGICVLSQSVTDTRTTLDLGESQDNIYILLLRLNGTSASWKITMR